MGIDIEQNDGFCREGGKENVADRSSKQKTERVCNKLDNGWQSV